MDQPDGKGFSPLHAAAIRNHDRAVSCLLAKGAYVNAVDNRGRTPLYCTIVVGNDDMFKLLLQRGADCTQPAADGFTPLMAAIQCDGQGEMLRKLLRRQQQQTIVNAESKTGITALHLAAAKRDLELVELLLDLGANPLAEADPQLRPVDMLGSDRAGDPHAAPGEHETYVTLRGLLERAASAAELVEGSGLKDILNGISIIAVLLVTVTFVGVLNPPGGPTPDSGYIR